VTCEYNDLGGIEHILVVDDGSVMNRERAEHVFSLVCDA
jgi:hypothetical protein